MAEAGENENIAEVVQEPEPEGEESEEEYLPCMLDFDSMAESRFDYHDFINDCNMSSSSESESESDNTTLKKGKTGSGESNNETKKGGNLDDNSVKWKEVQRGSTRKKFEFKPDRKGLNLEFLDTTASPLQYLHELLVESMIGAIITLINDRGRKLAAENAQRIKEENVRKEIEENEKKLQAGLENGLSNGLYKNDALKDNIPKSNSSAAPLKPTKTVPDLSSTSSCRNTNTSSKLRSKYLFHNTKLDDQMTTWQEFTHGEMYKFFLVLISLSLLTIPHHSLIFDRNFLLNGKWFSKVYDEKRFKMILALLNQVFDFNEIGRNKCRGLVAFVMKNAQNLYYPGKHLNVEEMVIGLPRSGWAHRSYDRSQRLMHQVKTLGIMDAETSYVFDIYINFGPSDRCFDPEKIRTDKLNSILDKLLANCVEGHHLHLDKQYCSYPVLKHLGEKYYYTGFIEFNGYTGITKKMIKQKLAVGEMVYYMDDKSENLIVKYRDTNVGQINTLISNNSLTKKTSAFGMHMPVMFQKYVRVKNEEGVHDIMQRFGGHHRPVCRWNENFFQWFFEIIQWNSYVLYKEMIKMENNLNVNERKIPSYLHYKGTLSANICRLAEKFMCEENGERKEKGVPSRCLCYRYGLIIEEKDLKNYEKKS